MADGPLASLFSHLLVIVGAPIVAGQSSPTQSTAQRVLYFCRESMASLVAFCVGGVVDVLLSEGDARRIPFITAVGSYSSLASFAVLVGHKDDLVNALRQAHHIAAILYQESLPDSKARTEAMARRCRFIVMRFYPAYAVMTALSIIMSFDLQSGLNVWLKQHSKILMVAKIGNDAFAALCAHIGLYTLISYTVCILGSISLLFREVGRLSKQPGKINNAAALSGHLIIGCAHLNSAIRLLLPHIIMGPFRIIPLKIEHCPPGMSDTPYKDFVWRSYRDRSNVDLWYYWANITTLFTVDDSYDFDLNWASWSSRGGWKENAFIMKPGCFCKVFPLHNPELWRRLMTVTFNDPTRTCPFPPAFYEIKNLSTDLSLNKVPVFFYGTWRVTLRLVRNEDQRAKLCALLFGKTVPK